MGSRRTSTSLCAELLVPLPNELGRGRLARPHEGKGKGNKQAIAGLPAVSQSHAQTARPAQVRAGFGQVPAVLDERWRSLHKTACSPRVPQATVLVASVHAQPLVPRWLSVNTAIASFALHIGTEAGNCLAASSASPPAATPTPASRQGGVDNSLSRHGNRYSRGARGRDWLALHQGARPLRSVACPVRVRHV